MIQINKWNNNIGFYDEHNKIFFSNEYYQEKVNEFLSKIKPDEIYHICLSRQQFIAYDCIDNDININTIIFIGNNKIFHINDKGHKIQESYEWKSVKN